MLLPAVARRLAERLDSLLRAEHGDDVAGRFIALEQLRLHDEVMRLVAFSPRLAGLAAELLGEPAIRIYHTTMPSRRNPGGDARRGITTPSTSRSPLFRPSQHGSRSRPSRPTWAHWLLPGVLMCVTWSPICHSTRSERHMTRLSHVISSRVMWLSM